jgi:hypothetical protein
MPHDSRKCTLDVRMPHDRAHLGGPGWRGRIADAGGGALTDVVVQPVYPTVTEAHHGRPAPAISASVRYGGGVDVAIAGYRSSPTRAETSLPLPVGDLYTRGSAGLAGRVPA